jgi:hypothetical protein
MTGTMSCRHTNEGWGDSDWGLFAFHGGRVTGVEFFTASGTQSEQMAPFWHVML